MKTIMEMTISLLKKNCFIIVIISSIALISCKDEAENIYEPSYISLAGIDLEKSIYYSIDLNDLSEDKFRVKAYLSGLTESNSVFQFAAVVPGTYRFSNFGRYVSRFQAFDKDGQSYASEKLSTNQWEISNPEKVYYLEYDIFETWDIDMEKPSVYLMGGTSLETDHVLLNGFGVLGYPEGMKKRQFYLHLEYPDGWTAGTSLEKVDQDLYIADNYDELVDSPVLLGNLTTATVNVGQTKIDLFTYSKSGSITSNQLLPELDGIMQDAQAFLKSLPVDRYSFLFHFEGRAAGALEHSYSSVYVLRDGELSPSYIQLVRNISAHEFFHVVTPLNIRSEIIENFNFAMPVASRHLWLYEGVTEWASDMMQYRNESLSIQDLLSEIRSKYISSLQYDQSLSLTNMSLDSYGERGGSQFRNVYLKGALVAYLLDIELLERSNGKSGLRELILKLIDTYGSENAFQEDQFFDELVKLTYPEIESFIDLYIKGITPLPLENYLQKVGIDFDKEERTIKLIESPTEAQQQMYAKWSVNF